MTIKTLFRSITGGIDWIDAAQPLRQVSEVLEYAFMIYIAFGLLCVLNVITGVFVENANSITREDEESVLLEVLEDKKRWIDDVARLMEDVFNEVDDVARLM